jgi:hypothetical protein
MSFQSFARAPLAPALLALAIALAAPSSAAAEIGPPQLVSKTVAEQTDEASATTISADGRYLAFRGAVGGYRGVFREDLETGAIAKVATGSAYLAGAAGADARNPSISADGRYVSFTTNAPLDPSDDTQAQSADVYVADMAASPPTYELASALDGSPHGLTYSGAGGSEASGRVALSASGREVAFFTTASSDLTSGAGGSTPGTPTPAGQVVVRDLEDDGTTLVSVQRSTETGEMTDLPVAGGAVLQQFRLALLRGAALSADGTTVAWLGAHLPAQVPLPAGEAQAISELDSNGSFPYDEPLWRRIADGPQAPTRRIVGPIPGATAKNTDLNSAMGWLGVGGIDGVPQLSADGRSVALIGNPTEATNVFLAHMGEGMGSGEVEQLTREISVNPTNPAGVTNVEPYVPLNGHIWDLAISPDGQRIAFATARQQFPLAPPNLITPRPAQLGLVELYLIDREGETLQRVTHGYGGIGEASSAPTGAAQNGAGADSPSFGAGGSRIAFASSASNLVRGDGNEASDAFVVEDGEASQGPGPGSISPGPPPISREQPWQLTLSAFSLPSGAVRLVAVVPAAGTVRARAKGALGADAAPRDLAGAQRRALAANGGAVKLTLKLPSRLRGLAHSKEGLYAMARVSFHRRGQKALRGELQVRFHAHPRKRRGWR